MNPVQYILLDRTLEMSVGKAAAQASHAAVQSYRLSKNELIDAWMLGKRYAKVVLEVEDLATAQEYIESRGFLTELIIDEGRTEFGGKLTRTALGVEIVDKDCAHVRATFGEFDLYGTHERRVLAKNKRDLQRAVPTRQPDGSYYPPRDPQPVSGRPERKTNRVRALLKKR